MENTIQTLLTGQYYQLTNSGWTTTAYHYVNREIFGLAISENDLLLRLI